MLDFLVCKYSLTLGRIPAKKNKTERSVEIHQKLLLLWVKILSWWGGEIYLKVGFSKKNLYGRVESLARSDV